MAATSPNSKLFASRTLDELDPTSLPLRFLRFPSVRARTGLSRSTIWRLERRGEFPRHRRISSNAVGWVEAELSNWIRQKANATSPVHARQELTS